ncbi:hypothetical protein FKX85_16595 [Echinicola soli]|uniref:Lipoprotein n=1 Tax=Echinicola soli TaxID=2591634 RepID=A0A514CL83_9BACT|nr:hypothetical protein [Echinicola soli]QDH80572.1 hypothetical protein FKX85_16595 [Echinicola soli]
MRAIIILIIFIFSFCSQQKGLSEEERLIYNSMNVNQVYGEDGRTTSLLDIATGFEEKLIERKYLKSISKNDYKEFYYKYIVGDSIIDMKSIYKTNNMFITMVYPSTLSRSWYIFDETIKRNKDHITEESTIYGIFTVLGDMFYEDSFRKDLLERYLDSLSEQEFKNKSIYRVPLLVFLYADLESKYARYSE